MGLELGHNFPLYLRQTDYMAWMLISLVNYLPFSETGLFQSSQLRQKNHLQPFLIDREIDHADVATAFAI